MHIAAYHALTPTFFKFMKQFTHKLNRLTKQLLLPSICILAITSSVDAMAGGGKPPKTANSKKATVKDVRPCTLYVNTNSGAFHIHCPPSLVETGHNVDAIPAPEEGWQPVGPVDASGGLGDGTVPPGGAEPKTPCNNCGPGPYTPELPEPL